MTQKLPEAEGKYPKRVKIKIQTLVKFKSLSSGQNLLRGKIENHKRKVRTVEIT